MMVPLLVVHTVVMVWVVVNRWWGEIEVGTTPRETRHALASFGRHAWAPERSVLLSDASMVGRHGVSGIPGDMLVLSLHTVRTDPRTPEPLVVPLG